MFFNQKIIYSNPYTSTNNSFQFTSLRGNYIVNFQFNEINSLQKFLINNAQKDNIGLKFNQKKFNKVVNYAVFNQDYSKYKIFFLRVQRRYNKRRYSKVRVTSRPSFFAGITLSSILVGLFWGGTIKSVD